MTRPAQTPGGRGGGGGPYTGPRDGERGAAGGERPGDPAARSAARPAVRTGPRSEGRGGTGDGTGGGVPPGVRDRDPVTRRLVELTRPGEPLAGLVRPELLPDAFRRCWGPRTLSRPMVVPAAELAAAAADVLGLFDLLAGLPERLFGSDLERYGRTLGIDPHRTALLERFPIPGRTRYGRADLYHDGDAFRLLEFNVASDLGGVDRCVLQQSLVADPAFRAFAEDVGLAFEHTGRRLADDLRAAAAPVTGGRDPAVAVLCAPGGLGRFRHLLDAFAEMMRGIGVDLRLGEVTGIRVARGRVTLDGHAVDVVLRFFTIDDVVDTPGAAAWAEPLLHAALDGTVVLWTPLDSTLLSNKGALALLSSPGTRALLDADEEALVERLLPPSWLLTDGSGPDGGDLLDHCRAHREHLVLKPLRDFGGCGVLPGWECGDADWERELLAGLGRGHLVQERVTPRTEPVVDAVSGEVEDWVATWGLFVTPSGYAGADVRAAPAAVSGVVNYGTNPLTRTTGVFTHGAG